MTEAIQWLFEFVIFTVIVKGIIAHLLADKIMEIVKHFASKTIRGAAIWDHYHNRAEGNGHQTDSVLACTDGKCEVFRKARPVLASQDTSQ